MKVRQWGDVSYTKDKLSDFMGERKSKFLRTVKELRAKISSVVDSRDINLSYLANLYGSTLE